MKRLQKQIRILNLIYKIWKKNPDLRLGQLINNCSGIGDVYYLQDDRLEERLKQIYKEK